MTTTPPTSHVSRRTLVRGAAWSVPVVSVAAVAPAFAASTSWTITSASYEGTSGGTRNNAATYQFRFTLTVLAGTTVTAPVATFTSADWSFIAGYGTAIAGVDPTGTVDGWAATGSDDFLTSTGAYRTFTFTRGNIVGPATVTLNFTMSDVANGDIGAGGRPFTFTSGDALTGPTTQFTVNQVNNNNTSTGYVTTPHV